MGIGQCRCRNGEMPFEGSANVSDGWLQLNDRPFALLRFAKRYINVLRKVFMILQGF